MFDRFTDEARRAVVLATEQVRALEHRWIGTEHLFLGVLLEHDGVGAQALLELGLTVPTTRAVVREVVGPGTGPAAGKIPFTPRAKRALERALHAALELGDEHVGTEHLLFGLLDGDDDPLRRVLDELHITPDAIRAAVLEHRAGAAEGEVQGGEGGESRMVVVTSAARSGGVFMGMGMGMGPMRGQACAFCGRDLWDVDHYVAGAGVVMCDACVDAATGVVARVRREGGDKELHLPPRVSGTEPEPGAAEAAIETLRQVFGNPPATVDVDLIEDAPTLMPSLREVQQRYAGQAPIVVHVERLRFVAADAVDARFTLTLPSGPSVGFEGRLVRRDGRWLVGRELVAQVLTRGGSPPRRV